jgi:L-alanine-DL-glutamate epimerase-like enolase superfamily enzyme
MRPSGFELWRLSIPLKGGFAHAASARTTSELALVAVHDGEGRVGWGEALPRTYVTGEDLDTLLGADAPKLAEAWLGREIADMDELLAMLRRELPADRYGLSCFGAFELALLDLSAATSR